MAEMPNSEAVRNTLTGRQRWKRQIAILAARCAMGSWLVLAVTPVVVVVCALA